MWGLKVFSVEVTNVVLKGFSRRGYQCGVYNFYEGQWLRARLCCRKISDSIFWLFCFTPRCLAGALPKEGPQEI